MSAAEGGGAAPTGDDAGASAVASLTALEGRLAALEAVVGSRRGEGDGGGDGAGAGAGADGDDEVADVAAIPAGKGYGTWLPAGELADRRGVLKEYTPTGRELHMHVDDLSSDDEVRAWACAVCTLCVFVCALRAL